MKNKPLFKSGFGIDTLMIFGFVVLPMLVFIVFLIIEYWRIMRIDNNLKLIANMLVQKAVTLDDFGDYSMFSDVLNKSNSYCPKNTSLKALSVENNNSKGLISVTISYKFDGVFFKPDIKASVTNLSYHDLNLTAHLACQ